jgi:hypothetical protein
MRAHLTAEEFDDLYLHRLDCIIADVLGDVRPPQPADDNDSLADDQTAGRE